MNVVQDIIHVAKKRVSALEDFKRLQVFLAERSVCIQNKHWTSLLSWTKLI